MVIYSIDSFFVLILLRLFVKEEDQAVKCINRKVSQRTLIYEQIVGIRSISTIHFEGRLCIHDALIKLKF